MLRPLCDALCAEAGFEPEVVFECHDLPAMWGFVAAGLGVAIVPADRSTVAQPPPEGVHRLAITDGGAVREVGMAWSAERRPLAAVDLFRAHVLARAAAGLLPGLRGQHPRRPDGTASD